MEHMCRIEGKYLICKFEKYWCRKEVKIDLEEVFKKLCRLGQAKLKYLMKASNFCQENPARCMNTIVAEVLAAFAVFLQSILYAAENGNAPYTKYDTSIEHPFDIIFALLGTVHNDRTERRLDYARKIEEELREHLREAVRLGEYRMMLRD